MVLLNFKWVGVDTQEDYEKALRLLEGSFKLSEFRGMGCF